MKMTNTLPNVSGIYCILNIISGKDYIGSSCDIQRRAIEHRKLLRHNKHDNPRLQNAWNKYGESNFLFFLVEYVEENELVHKEQEYINKENPFYNINKNAWRPPYTGKIVHQYDMDGKYIKSFKSGKEAARNTALADTNINAALSGKVISCGNYLWSYKKVIKFQARKHKQKKPVVQYSLDGKYIKIWDSAGQAARGAKCGRAAIQNCVKGKYKSAGGYLWKYYLGKIEKTNPYPKIITTNKKVVKFSLDNRLLANYNSIVEAGKDNMINPCNISTNLIGITKTAGGFIWRYA